MKLLLLLGALTLASQSATSIKEWFAKQHNALGQYCCNEADGAPWLSGYTFNRDNSVTLSDKRLIPSPKVLKGPNPTGHAILWQVNGEIICFSPGTLT